MALLACSAYPFAPATTIPNERTFGYAQPVTRRGVFTIILFTLLLALAAWVRVSVGPSPATPEQREAFMSLRIDRALAAGVVGAALAVAGVLLQSLLRNPLASPDLLGLASGAGLGIMIAAVIAFEAGRGISPYGLQTPAALIGASAALGLVYLLSQRGGWPDPAALVLIGVVVALLCGSAIELVRNVLPDQGFAANRLIVGAIRDDLSRPPLLWTGGIVLACCAIAFAAARAMDAAALGDDEAHSVGVHMPALRITLFVLSGILTACAVVLAGPIGFVGLVCPHVARLIGGPSHRALVISAALCGAALLIFADSLVKSIDLGGGRLPLSVVTSLLGGPLFIWLLRRRQRGELPT